MRIGERLIRDEIITSEQLDEGLRARDLRGGRIGSVLVELGHVDADTLAECLGRHHGMPAALTKHMALASAEIQARLPAAVAAQWAAVPMAWLLGSADQIAVAVMDPLPAEAIEQLGAALGAQVVLAIAPERRLLEQLQQSYGVSSADRAGSPPALADPSEDDAQCDIHIHIEGEELDHTRLEHLALDEMTDREMSDRADAPAPAPDTAQAPAKPPGDPPDTPAAPPTPPQPKDPTNWQDTLQALRQATDREQAGELVIAAMREALGQPVAAAVLLHVRDRLAVGWKGFVRDMDSSLVEAVALPVDTPSVIYRSLETGAPYVGPPPERGAAVDHVLWALLKTEPPPLVAVAPVVVGAQTVCLLYAHMYEPGDAGPGAAGLGDQLAALAQALAAALARLDASGPAPSRAESPP